MSDLIELRLEQKPENMTNVLVEAKIDGSRHTWNGTDIVSDRGIVRNDRFPHIVKELQTLKVKGRGEIAVPFGNVLVLNKKENWNRARFYLFDMYELDGQDTTGANHLDNRHVIEKALSISRAAPVGKYTHLRAPFRFKDFQTGWNHVLKHDLEGLVLKDLASTKEFKVKYRKELKVPIVGFEPGAVKGCFRIDVKGKIGGCSALSVAYVKQYHDMLAAGQQPYIEIEYLFLTADGIPFQPSLRRMGTLADLAVT